MKPLPVVGTFDPLSNGMHNSFLTKSHLEHYSTEATICAAMGRPRTSGKGVHMYKGVGFPLLILSHYFLNVQ